MDNCTPSIFWDDLLNLAAERRHVLAVGVSPRSMSASGIKAAQRRHRHSPLVPPLRGSGFGNANTTVGLRPRLRHFTALRFNGRTFV